MQASTLSILRADAKDWWYNKQLRAKGREEDARRFERQSIRQHVKFLRDGLGYTETLSHVSIYMPEIVHARGKSRETLHTQATGLFAQAVRKHLHRFDSVSDALAAQRPR